MKKTLFVLLAAALVLVSATACSQDPENPGDDTLAPAVSGDESDSGAESNPDSSDESGSLDAETDRPLETNPTFIDKSLTVVVIASNGTIRNNPDQTEESKIAWPSEGTELTVTGESTDWYRLNYKDGVVAYITKSITGDVALLEGFTDVEDEQVVVTGEVVNVRYFPSAHSEYSIRGQLTAGTVVTRVAVGESWSRILFTETVASESGDSTTQVVKEYYIHNDYIEAASESSADSATDTTASTDPVKE